MATAADLPGAPKMAKHKDAKVHAVNAQGAKAARELVAKNQAENKAQAERAHKEAKAAWPKAATLVQDSSGARAGNRPLVDVRSTSRPKSRLLLPSAPAGPVVAADSGSGGKSTVKVLDQKSSERAGITGVLFSATSQTGGPAQVSIDYGSFASAVGGGWSNRLGLVSLPSCVLTTPENAECRKTTPLPSANSLKNHTVTADIASLPTGAPSTGKAAKEAKAPAAQPPAVFALMASDTGSPKGGGDLKATPLSASSSWESGSSSGAFTWSYPVPLPPPAAGPAPSLSFSYNTGSIDGRTANSNNQGSQVGEGFDLTSSYVERKYGTCEDDGQKEKYDLCWKYENASLVLNGQASELVKDDTSGKWRLKNDDASQVTWGTGADNGDANGEYWKVVTGDGTTYTFGLNKLPGADTQRTNSTWTAPVFGDDAGEPGYTKGATFADRYETQAWRWNLDLIQDVHGNAVSYWYAAETNNYAKTGDKTKLLPYTRGGTLSEIRYGQRADTLFTANASHKVTFDYKERCFAANCDTLTRATSTNWPDVPFDGICSATEADCRSASPAFFTRKRMTAIKTFAWSTALEPDNYAPIDTFDLTQEYLDAGDLGDTSDQTLVLKSIKRTGTNGGTVDVPPVDFTYRMRPNRVDADGDNIVPLTRPRINTITSETGAITTVTLSAPQCVRGTTMPAAEDDNALSCYPVYWPINGGDPALDWFHKYNVTAVTIADPAGQNDLVENSYEYANPGWHYNEDPLTPEKQRTWSEWRGYGKVTSYTGASGKIRSKTVSVFMQGMNGDKRKGTSTTRTATIAGVPLAGLTIPAINDDGQYSGFQRQQITYDGATALSASVTDPWSKETASQQKSYANTKAYYVRPATSYSHTFLTVPGTWRTTRTDSTYDDYGMQTQTSSEGDTAKTGDETCTRTWYARNEGIGLTSLTSRTRTVGALCSVTDDKLSLPATSATRGDVLADTATVYDDNNATAWTANQTPTLGLATWTGRAQSYPAANGTTDRDPAGSAGWQTVGKITYDTATAKLGRPLTSTDAAGDTTTTSYTPAAAGPLQVTVSTAPKLASNGQQHKSYAYMDLRGSVVRSIDANMASTYNTYDGLGRATATWLPNRAQSQSPNVKYDYLLARGKQPWTSVGTLSADGTYRTVYTIADALLRPLQTQSPSPNGGRILTDTRYDSRGLAYESYTDIWDKDKAPEGTYARAEYGSTPLQTQTVFDGLGRPVTASLLVYGVQKQSTTTSYTGDSVATTAVQGGTASRAIADALGRTTETRTYSGTTPNDPAYGGTAPGTSYTSVSQTYMKDGKKATATGPDKMKWSYGYDLFGRPISTTDPDSGKTTTTYTVLDQIATTKDARNTVLEYGYDELGRKTGLWQSPKSDANKLAAWTYDSVRKGAVTDAIRYEGGLTGKAYTKSVTAYDTLGRPTTTRLTLPSDDPLVTSGAIAATTDETASYRLDGTPNTVGAPAAGGLPSEIVQVDYTDFGLPKALSGKTGYVEGVSYSPLGDVEQLTLTRSGAAGVRKTFIGNTYEEGTRRLLRSTVNDQTHNGMLQDLTYKYDQAGNVLSIFDAAPLSGFTQADNQCFSYDGQRRVTEAWTPKTADCSTAGRTTANLGGAAPYWNSYTYTASGQRATEKTNTGTPQTRTYCYDQARPHALAGTTTGATCTGVTPQYTYDASGNTTKRVETPASATTQSLTWGPEGKLTKLTEAAAATPISTDYIYDADGQLLIRRDAAGETILYTGATEVHLKNAKKWGTRSYALAGTKVAELTNESGTPQLSFVAGDTHGTSSLAVSADDTQTVSKRYTTPFGAARGPAPTSWPDDKRFLGKPEDTNTSLTHIGAREYDSNLGQFVSVDPILSLDQAQSLNGYAYANNNPITFSDPTGLRPDGVCGGNTSRCVPSDSKSNESVDYHESWQYTGRNGWNWSSWIVDKREKKRRFENFNRITWTYLKPRQLKLNWTTAAGALRNSVSTLDTVTPLGLFGGNVKAYDWLVGKAGINTEDPEYEDGELIAAGFGILIGGAASGEATAAKVKCHSFLPGTETLMADGTSKNIEDVKVGDVVLATDPETGENYEKTVLDTIRTEDDKDFTDITVATKDGPSTIVATDTHPFWVPELKEWVEAGNLHPGAWLQTSAGVQVQILALKRYTKLQRTHDLTIDDVHTYYVLAGATPVLVHNCGGQVEYGGNELSQAVIQERLKTGNKSNNFAAVRYTDADGVSQIAVAVSSKGLGNHAERKLLRQYGDSITEAYSEFQPCTGTNKCRSRLAEAGIPTTWTWGWTTSAEGAAARSAKGKAVTSMFRDALSGNW
ncbi:nucleic acid/nucleotide deaminase domain-containing protein [Streptomyces sp. NPDC001194]|uniref:nucleic acid/nucleotide deaminase domain-containing protein n=1 Tax=Streptomyces sp. NPDC001194 TaxID=3364547 RepID=UPI0036C54702